MGRKYTFNDHAKLHFVTFTIINWVDTIIRDDYRNIIYDSIKYCQQNKGLEVYAYCLMTSHFHFIIGTEKGNLSDIVRDLKSYTSRQIRLAIENNQYESRKEWMLWMFKRAGLKNERNIDFQFWQQANHPVELNTAEKTMQRLHYIHQNHVEAGFVEKAEDWLHSSAATYMGTRKGFIELILLKQVCESQADA
jgi:putative transposase